jgi:hypothetical protein
MPRRRRGCRSTIAPSGRPCSSVETDSPVAVRTPRSDSRIDVIRMAGDSGKRRNSGEKAPNYAASRTNQLRKWSSAASQPSLGFAELRLGPAWPADHARTPFRRRLSRRSPRSGRSRTGANPAGPHHYARRPSHRVPMVGCRLDRFCRRKNCPPFRTLPQIGLGSRVLA